MTILLMTALALTCTLGESQSYGSGFGKMTWTTSDALGVYKWVSQFLPVVDDRPNGVVNCGEVGRMRVDQGTGAPSHGFGIHAVHCNGTSPRTQHEGCLSIGDVENDLDTELSSGEYSAWMDFSQGFWVWDLDPYVASFQKAGVPLHIMTWESGGGTYFSLLTRVHTSMMFVELLSETCTACASATKIELPRYVFAQGSTPADVFGSFDDQLLHPAKVTWPSSDAARERKLLASDGLGGRFATHTGDGGATLDVYDFTPLMAKATLQFHVAQRGAEDGGSSSWAEFEGAVGECYASTITDDMCGETTWMDNHIGFAVHGYSEVPTDAAKLKNVTTELSLPFHVTPNPRGSFAIYVTAGNGLSITFQVDQGDYTPPRPAPSGGGGMLDLCTDGVCAMTGR